MDLPTQRKVILKAEEENRARIAMVSELTEAVVRKDQFMSLMSHELRTPLNGVIQLSDALSRGAGEGDGLCTHKHTHRHTQAYG